MQHRSIGMILAVAIAFSAASTASAATFQASQQGTVKTVASNHRWTFHGARVFCGTFISRVKDFLLLTVSLSLLVNLSKCEAFGGSVTVTTGDLLYEARGALRFGRTQKFVITSAVGKCSIAILSENESSVEEFGTIKYTNNANGTITGEEEVTGIQAVVHGAVGSVCGEPGNTTGESTGTTTTELEGGRISIER
jgi:hypothetical protein